MTPNDAPSNKGIRRTAVILGAVAVAIYLGFIFRGVLQA